VGSGFSTGEHCHPTSSGTIFGGFLTFRRYQNCAWFFFLLVFVIVAGVGGKHFVNTPAPPATVVQVVSFGATIAGNMITWSTLSSDYTAYFHPRVSRFVKFLGGLYQNLIDLISKTSVGEFSSIRISASLSLL
jgi:purine-cytosine permease-like protein